MKRTRIAAGVLAVGVVAALTGCGSAGSSANSIKVVYLDDGTAALNTYMTDVTKDFKASHKGVTVDLEPIKATESDFYTKVALMQRTASTAPDVVYEDTFQIKADAAAGYLTPLDSYVAKWSDWSKFVTAGRVGGQGADGKQYGIPLGTDTQGLWYNKVLFKKAGIAVPWQPKTWADITSTAKILKAKLPGVTPINIFASKAGGEASSVRGAQTILSGTGDSLYTNGKWVTSSPGLTATLGFIRSIYKSGLALPNQTTSDPNYGNIPWGLLKSGKLAIDADGSFIANNWQSGGSSPWPAWTTTMAVAKWPTENGQAPGSTSMSGGWTFAVGSKSKAPATAFSYIETALNQKNSLAYAIGLSNIPVRSDVASDPSYLKSNPTAAFFSGQVAVTHFRPAIAAYPQISNQLTVATDAITTGNTSVAAAIAAYGKAVVGIVGQSKTTTQ